ncbi:peptidoglycan-binding domain-containing protein, partial [Bacillus licheniformis]
GPKTADAVKRFQSMYGLSQDGIYGPNTKAKLAAALKKAGYTVN